MLVDVFVDGVKLYNCPNAAAWPIMARCTDSKDERRFVVGIFYGMGKPDPIEDYLADYIEDVKGLKANCLTYKNESFVFDIRFYLGDAPARAYLKCTTGHTSKSGCEDVISVVYTMIR